MLRAFKKKIKQQFTYAKQYLTQRISMKKLFNQQLELVAGGIKNEKLQKIQMKPQRYAQLEAYFMKFINSKSQSGRVNGQHLTLVTGGRSVGKTTFVQSNLKAFIKIKQTIKTKTLQPQQPQYHLLKSPQFLEDQSRQKVFQNEYYLIIKFNFANNGSLNFFGFIHHFQTIIIKEIMDINSKFEDNYLLDTQIIVKILLSKYVPEYVFIYVKDFIFNVIQGKDSIYLEPQYLTIIEQHLQTIRYMDPNQYFQKNKFNELVKIIKSSIKKSEVQTTILVILSIFRRIQAEFTPKQYINEYYESGIQTSNFLFDVLNFICGLGQLNHSIMKQYLAQQIKGKNIINYQNFILSGNHIDTVLCLLNLDQLKCSKQKLFIDFYDNIIVRIANQSNLRTHFPVILEICDNVELKNLQTLGKMSLENPAVLQIPGYFQYLIRFSNLAQILNQTSIDKLFPILGRSPYVWTQALQQMSKGTKLSQFINGSKQLFKKQRIILQAKINHIFCHQSNMASIDNGTLKYKIQHYLNLIHDARGFMRTQYAYYYVYLFTQPAFEGLFKQGIIFDHFYNNAMQLCNGTQIFGIKQLLQQYKKRNGLKYKIWKWRNQKYKYAKRQIRYSVKRETEIYKYYRFLYKRSHYHVRYYYGPTDDYQYLYKNSVVKRQISSV